MEIRQITKTKDFLSLESDWNALLQRCNSDIVCLTHEWFKCWWRGYADGNKLFVLLAKENGRLAGIAPLMISFGTYRGFPVRKVCFMENSNSPRVDFIAPERKPEFIRRVVDFLGANRHLWDMVSLEKIPKQSESADILPRVLEERKHFYTMQDSMRSPFIPVDSDWETYFSKRSKNFRKQLKNKLNRVHKLGQVAIEEVKRPEDAVRVLPEVFGVSKRSWKNQNGTAITCTRGKQTFFEELTKTASLKGWLSIWLLRANGKAIAMEYHLKYKHIVYALRADFDEEYRDVSPGSVLEQHITKQVFRNNYAEFDLCGDSQEYKMKWTDTFREHFKFNIFNRSIYPTMLRLVEFKGIPLLKRTRAWGEVVSGKFTK